MKNRCGWETKDDLYTKYHDKEWGVPLRDDTKLFEFLTLESFQAGLSWHLILKKRDNFRKAFANFVPDKVAKFDERDVERLLNNEGIVRNKLKIRACINNAQRFLEIQKEFGSFQTYIWGFVNHKPIVNTFSDLSEIPAKTDLSDLISNDLKKTWF